MARFAESNGFAFDKDRPAAFHYRDFVIKALNEDMPYDRFVRLQIAGDQIGPDDYTSQAATGFLAAGPFTSQQTQKERERSRYEQLDDMVSTLGTSLLGLTVGCSRCHSHKYDPISQEEYYSFFAVWNQSEDADRGNESPILKVVSESQRLQRMVYEKEIAALEKQRLEAAPAGKVEIGKGPIRPRFVRVGTPGRKNWLSLAEVQVFSGGGNVAVKGKATQSSTGFSGPPALAIDGNTDGDYHTAKSTTHTLEDQGPWWEVDLGSTRRVDKVILWNRTDGGVGSRLTGFRVALLDGGRKPVFVQRQAAAPMPSRGRAECFLHAVGGFREYDLCVGVGGCFS